MGKRKNKKDFSIKKLKNGDFEVVSTSYNIPVKYIYAKQLFKWLDSWKLSRFYFCGVN